MNVLIPWDELDDEMRRYLYDCDRELYDARVIEATRPLTPDDVRGMMRGWDEWTADEQNEFIRVADNSTNYQEDISIAIDIATRPAPVDPWEEMDNHMASLRHCGMTDIAEFTSAWERLKATRGDK